MLQLFSQIIILGLLFIAGHVSADDNTIKITVNKTIDAISNASEVPVTTSTSTSTPTTTTTTTTTSSSTTAKLSTSTTTQPFPLLEDLISAEKSSIKHDNDDDDEKNTAKRTISGKFTGPIVVDEERNLFTPNDEFIRKQRINVQIIEPESHNNGQFLKETVFVRQENNTVISTKTTTTSTTERPARRKNIVVEQKLLAPYQSGYRLASDARQRQLSNDDDDCDDETERANNVVTEKSNRIVENVDIQQNTKVQKIIYKDEPRPTYVFGARVTSTLRPPCDQALPCSTPRVAFKASPTPRLRPINSTPLIPPRIYTTPRIVTAPRIVTSTVVSAPRIVTTPIPVVSTVTPVPVPIKTVTNVVPVVTEKPVYIHTHSEVPVVQKEYVHLPPKIVDRPVIHKEYVQLPPQVQVVEKPRVVVQKEYVQLPPQERIVPVEVEKLVVKEVPINNVIEKHIQHPPTVVEKFVPYPVASKPIEVEKIVEVPVDRVVEKPVQVRWIFIAIISTHFK